jgi:hypothetical protein
MGDDAREYIRAAQAAEISGDKARAVENLRKAATLSRGQGNTARALQLLRHARRLDGESTELADELSRLEWIPDRPLDRAAGAEEADRALAPLDEMEKPKHLIERGPTRADPALQAWCSFCCRPRTEVGDLVAGPAGAFICAACIGEAGRLLAERSNPIASSEAEGDREVSRVEALRALGALRSYVEGKPADALSRERERVRVRERKGKKKDKS